MNTKKLYLDRDEWIKECEKLNLWRSIDTPNMAFTSEYVLKAVWYRNSGEGYILA
jgi:hypothetical protein